MSDPQEVLSAALALPERDRADVVVALLESFDDPDGLFPDDDLLDEADRREAMMEADPGMELSHEELMAAFSHRRRRK